MDRVTKIYTRTGDAGQTALFGGGRVSKADPRVAAYGDVDELNAALGAVLACEPVEFERDLLQGIQRDLFAIGGRLASPDPERVGKALAKAQVTPERIASLEAAIDRADASLSPLSAFVLPGGTMKGALFHVARTVCRRAERSVVALSQDATAPPHVLAYLNRLSDLLFTLARLANRTAGAVERTW
ncbi:MAG: cob(I)yrinic acid a,c-diamide adenosyltransferase [Gemmatimonadetes bacterium]|nr:cob(I)yrinic acid a,c-diamide adenosyltransferase [Gemmatimonadota bacterium]MBI2536682.1 cob(I)yrinic acid a,c-diamide adenosyltransferase [Gemmatimonadota bacterium]MBI2614202.1 cob(I)yrinic acid a,c-diamide adenosyltransferase [Gemmatimonadota bacterium]